jgi:hypothetical protein
MAALAIPAILFALRGVRKGWRSGWLSLLGAVIFLALMVLVAVARGRIRGWFEGLAGRGRRNLEQRLAKEALGRGTDFAEGIVDRGTAAARGAVDSVTKQVKSDWDRYVSRSGGQQSGPTAMECPSCGSYSRASAAFCSECGKPLPIICKQCQYVSRPGARFCEDCGDSLID